MFNPRNMKAAGAILLLAALVLSGCRPPEIEGTVINMQKELYDDAFNSAQKAIELYPENAEAWFYYGWLQGDHKQDYAKMNEAFNKSMALNPAQKVTVAGQPTTNEAAITAYRNNKFAENFNQAVKGNYNKAVEATDADQKRQLFEKAREKLQRALEIDPSRTEAFQPLALTYIMLGDTAEAENVLMKGLKDSPQNEALLLTAADMYVRTKQWDKAADLLSEALAVNPQNSTIYEQLGNIESNRQNWDKANEHYGKAIELDPDNYNLAYNIGVSLYNQKKFPEAIPYFRKSIQSEGEHQVTYKILAQCYYHGEQFDEGMTFLEGAVETYPNDAEIWEYLGLIYGRKMMEKEAKAAFEKSKVLKQAEGN